MISSPTTTGPILPHVAPNVPDPKSKKHGQSDYPNEQSATKKRKESPKKVINMTADDDKDEEEEPAKVKANASINKDFEGGNCASIGGHGGGGAGGSGCEPGPGVTEFAQRSALFQQSL